MTAAAIAILSAALAAVDGTSAEVTVSGRAETSALAFSADGAAPRGLAALDVLPRVGLLLDHKTLRLGLAYEPQLRVSQALAYPGSDAAVVHGGSLRAEWDVDPLWRATGSARATVRLLDLAAGAGSELARLLDLRAPLAPLRYADSGASAAIEGRPTRRLTVAAAATIDASGAAELADRPAMPWMRELSLAASATSAETREDTIRLELAARSAAFEVGGASFATLSAAWTRALARGAHLRLAAAASQALSGSAPARTMPGGDVELEATPGLAGRPLRLAAAARVGPAFDRYGGRIFERLALEARAAWAVAPRLSLSAAAVGGGVLEAQGYTASRADLRGAWRWSPRVTFYAAVWNEWHHDPRLAAGAAATYLGTGVGIELAPGAR
ncbi:MAG TPA: hypothetical protein VFK90_15505 [Anaeromyxobacter sp.]|nr:hypothetical protein [Anaeromyxobacter sp.]